MSFFKLFKFGLTLLLLVNFAQSETTAVQEFIREVELTADEADSIILKDFMVGMQIDSTVQELR